MKSKKLDETMQEEIRNAPSDISDSYLAWMYGITETEVKQLRENPKSGAKIKA